MLTPEPLELKTGSGETLDALWMEAAPDAPVLVLAHGAGAGMRHTNMSGIAQAFCAAGISTLRFNFPFIQAGRRRVDSQAVAVSVLRDAFAFAARRTAGTVFMGGHSFGGRMASHAALPSDGSKGKQPAGLIFCAFPLHPANRPGTARAAHLPSLQLPMLFLSGTRDALAAPELLERTVENLGSHAQLHWLHDADHSYKTRQRERVSLPEVFDEMAAVARSFIDEVSA